MKAEGVKVLEELTAAWRRAQVEASLAYCHWRRSRDRTAYAIYRAAQDRADAAQDALSDHCRAERLKQAMAL
jgi:hypothetical protein